MGALGLFFMAVADSSFLSIPEGNDLVIVVLSAGSAWSTMAFYVSITILGSLTGCFLLFWVGWKGGEPVLLKRFPPRHVARAEKLYARLGIYAVAIPSILPPPCPFKIFVLSAGVFRLSPVKFFLAVAAGRTVRYSSWGILAVLYGAPVKNYILQGLSGFGIALFGVFLAVLVLLLFILYRRSRPGFSQPGID